MNENFVPISGLRQFVFSVAWLLVTAALYQFTTVPVLIVLILAAVGILRFGVALGLRHTFVNHRRHLHRIETSPLRNEDLVERRIFEVKV